jgi:tetratricopeptide (TPR) repeat protein
MKNLNRLGMLTAASLFAISISGIGVVFAAGDPDPPGSRNPGPIKQESPASKGTKDSSAKPKKKKTSDQEFRDGYRAAYALVQAGEYKAAFAAFKALDADDTPDVANYLGYTARKLGDYEASRFWYERALASDPKHVRTWQYYGMWHVEQGNMLKAADFLEQIRLICGGTGCKEYQDLKGGMEGTVVY